MAVWQWTRDFCCKAVALAFAFCFAQGPMWLQDLQQQLEARLSELSWQVEGIDRAASAVQKTRQAYIEKFCSQSDADFVQQGEMMKGTLARCERFTLLLHTLQDAPLWQRPMLCFVHFDKEVFAATWHSFEWGLAFNGETLVYAAVGLLFGWGLFEFLLWIGSHAFAALLRKKEPPAGA
jgi:hypothetical protein